MENKVYVILLWDFDFELLFFVLLIAYYSCFVTLEEKVLEILLCRS